MVRELVAFRAAYPAIAGVENRIREPPRKLSEQCGAYAESRCIRNDQGRRIVFVIVHRFAPIENIDFMPEMKDKSEHRMPARNGVQQMAPLNRWQQTGSQTGCEADHRDESGLKRFQRMPRNRFYTILPG